MKSITLFSLLIVALSAATACAQLSDREQAGLAQQYRRSLGLEPTVAKIKAGEVDPKRLAVIRAVLSATNEVHIHQQRGATGNSVFLSPDGLQEAVYGPEQQLVSDGINDGSYNYFNPYTDAARHYFFDIHPWILMGNTSQDPTTPKERVSSYMADLEDGILRASKTGTFPAVDIRSLRDGEPETYAIFLNAIQAADANELFAAIESQAILDDAARIPLLGKIEVAFQNLYAK